MFQITSKVLTPLKIYRVKFSVVSGFSNILYGVKCCVNESNVFSVKLSLQLEIALWLAFWYCKIHRFRERQDIKRTIFLSWKIVCESIHLSHKNRLVFSALLRNLTSEFWLRSHISLLVIRLSSSVVCKIVSLFVLFVYFCLTDCLRNYRCLKVYPKLFWRMFLLSFFQL